jgi:hypothetical protein
MLDPNIFPSEFDAFMKRKVSLSDSFLPLYDGDFILPAFGDYPSAFASAYDIYSYSGEVLGATHEPAHDPGIIEAFMRSYSTSVTEFAQALADFWSTVLIVPGAPMHGGVSVQSVVNDASVQVGAFESAILASITTELTTPVFIQLINNIEAIALPSVTWTVTEMIPVGSSLVPTPFLEKVF